MDVARAARRALAERPRLVCASQTVVLIALRMNCAQTPIQSLVTRMHPWNHCPNNKQDIGGWGNEINKKHGIRLRVGHGRLHGALANDRGSEGANRFLDDPGVWFDSYADT